MRIFLRSSVEYDFDKVTSGFGSELFEFLLPPKFMASLVTYEGSVPGSKVHIRFKIPYPSDWISVIKSEEKDDNKYVFMDEGEVLPFGLKKWKHIHSVIKIDNQTTEIIDDMNFSTGFKFLDLLYFPILFLAFYPRKKLYKKYFEK